MASHSWSRAAKRPARTCRCCRIASCARRLLALEEARRLVDAAEGHVVAELEKRSVCERDHGLSTGGWLAREAMLPLGGGPLSGEGGRRAVGPVLVGRRGADRRADRLGARPGDRGRREPADREEDGRHPGPPGRCRSGHVVRAVAPRGGRHRRSVGRGRRPRSRRRPVAEPVVVVGHVRWLDRGVGPVGGRVGPGGPPGHRRDGRRAAPRLQGRPRGVPRAGDARPVHPAGPGVRRAVPPRARCRPRHHQSTPAGCDPGRQRHDPQSGAITPTARSCPTT